MTVDVRCPKLPFRSNQVTRFCARAKGTPSSIGGSIEALWSRILRAQILSRCEGLSRLAHFAGSACGITTIAPRSPDFAGSACEI
jgi:hypothetical protein